MGFLSEAAQRGFKRAGSGSYVPEWYKITVGVGGFFIVAALGFSALTSEKPGPVPPSGTTTISEESVSGAAQVEGSKELKLIGGGSATIPNDALAVAEKAALAIWNGDWSGVVIDGDIPDASTTFPNAVVGRPSVMSVSDASISFVFSLDETGNGTWDQDFQVTVITSGAGWAYPAYIG
jgi:hypothetical protein